MFYRSFLSPDLFVLFPSLFEDTVSFLGAKSRDDIHPYAFSGCCWGPVCIIAGAPSGHPEREGTAFDMQCYSIPEPGTWTAIKTI